MTLNDITPLFEEARARARARRAPVLVSFSRRIAPTDPLGALENVVRLSASDERVARNVAEGCFYWTRQADAFGFCGIGAAVTLDFAGPDRFRLAEAAWSSLLDGAIIDDGDDSASAPGPILAGGFAFHENGPRTPTWDGFPAAGLVVPRVLVVSAGGRSSVTTTFLVGPDALRDAEEASGEAVKNAIHGSRFSKASAVPALSARATIDYNGATPRSSWQEMVALAVDAIGKGELEKVVLARSLRASASRPINVVSVLRHLRDVHRDSFVFGCWRGKSAFVGASPERLVRLEGRTVLASGLAGTIRRGSTADEDSASARALLASAKDRAEHAAVRSALASVLGELCDGVEAPGEPELLTLPHVHHLHTPFRARLKDGASLLGLAERLHPTPAVGGTPRAAALAFIERHERLDRGWYASPIGWISRHGGEFAVALRSALVAGCEATLFAGCGIVAGSDPRLEYDESSLKMKSMQAAIEAVISAPGDAVAPGGERRHITA